MNYNEPNQPRGRLRSETTGVHNRLDDIGH